MPSERPIAFRPRPAPPAPERAKALPRGAHARLTVADLSPDQREAYDAIRAWTNRGSGTKSLLSLGGYAGCLDGSTVLRYTRGNRVHSRPITMADFFLKFNGQAGSGRGAAQRWAPDVETYLSSLWPDGTVARNRVVACFQSGVKPVLHVDFSNGQHLVLTEDHPLAIPGGGFVKAGDLSVRDVVLARGTMKCAPGKGRRPIDERPPRVVVNTKFHPIGAVKFVWCNGVQYRYMRVARARLVVEAAMNGLGYEEYVHALKTDADRAARFSYLSGGVDVHHVDENTLNDQLSNLEVLEHADHARVHDPEPHLQKDYVHEVRITGMRRAGERMTYDIQMASPANNFTANGIFVHNTGKSALVSVLARELPGPLAFCAFTGKASSVLGRKLAEAGIATVNRIVPRPGEGALARFEPRPYCGTIHGLIYRPCDLCMVEEEEHEHTFGPGCSETEYALAGDADPQPDVPAAQRCLACHPPPPRRKKTDGPCSRCHDARYLRRTKLDRPYGLFVVDEASMVSDDMRDALLSYGVPILAVGDHGQLPPVRGAGSMMREPDIRLEQIHRQAAGNPIIALSARIRETGHLDERLEDGDKFATLALRNFDAWIAERFPPDRRVADPSTPAGILGTVIVCWTNKLRVDMNYNVRDALDLTDTAPQRGEAVICLRNKPPVYNGMRGVLLDDATPAGNAGGKAPKWRMSVDFVEDGQVAKDFLASEHQFFAEKTLDYDAALDLGVSMSQLGELYDFGYALTCHKMQGSQAPEVAVVVEPGLARTMNREDRTRWLYTACTRASERLLVIR